MADSPLWDVTLVSQDAEANAPRIERMRIIATDAQAALAVALNGRKFDTPIREMRIVADGVVTVDTYLER